MKIVTVDEMRKLEAACIGYGLSTDNLMERAGLEVARVARRMMVTAAGRRVLVMVGSGNNGGDGLVAARHLARWGATVTGYIVSGRPEPDPKLTLAYWEDVAVLNAASDVDFQCLGRELERSRLVIDAVLGTGRARPLAGTVREAMLRVAASHSRVLALDLPTGVDADTGEADAAAPAADVTVALGYLKRCHVTSPGSERSGRLEVVDIGVPSKEAEGIRLELLGADWVRDRLPGRPRDGHKGTFGHTLIIGGSINYSGAAYLATQSALRSGSGLVTLVSPMGIQPLLAYKLTEAVHLPVPDGGTGTLGPEGAAAIKGELSDYNAVAVGCGMGWSLEGQRFMEGLLLDGGSLEMPLVVDADGLNNLSGIEKWWERLAGPVVLTPHPGEMSRLTGVPTEEIQGRRIETAKEWAERWGQVVVLKGANTVVADADGSAWVSPFANPVLASGGTGDVLTGIIAGLMAQGSPAIDSACCGVFLHGTAAQLLREDSGDRGGLASDLVELLPEAFKIIIEG